MVDYNCFDVTQNIPLWQYDNNSKKHSNVTAVGLKIFQNHYKNIKINPEKIFYYVYGLLNDPKYENTYQYNLRRKLPQIPLVKNFTKYSEIGQKLFKLHCNFNDVDEYELERIDKIIQKNQCRLSLKKYNDYNTIILDDITNLNNIPDEVFQYTIRGRNPIKCVLDYYAESKNKISKKRGSNDENIRKKFSMYKFEDHKENVIILLKKITTVCIETVKLRKELELLEWGPQPELNLTLIEKISQKNKLKNPKNQYKEKKNACQ